MVDESEDENGDEEAYECEIEIETGDADEVVDGDDELEPVVELQADGLI